MPFCPVCKYEYVDGIDRCSDCADLVAQLDDEIAPENHINDENLVSVFRTNYLMESSVVADMLRSSGIAVFEQAGIFGQKPMESAQEYMIYVLESQAEEAVRLIGDREISI